jgi:hypothetical protein
MLNGRKPLDDELEQIGLQLEQFEVTEGQRCSRSSRGSGRHWWQRSSYKIRLTAEPPLRFALGLEILTPAGLSFGHGLETKAPA